jgi:hypothetical protein
MVIVAENDTGSQQSTGGELGKSSLRKRHWVIEQEGQSHKIYRTQGKSRACIEAKKRVLRPRLKR